jgi:hypothetical protein
MTFLIFANSASVPVPTRFSKQQLFEELAWFMPALARSFVRIYGHCCWSGSSTVAEPSLQSLQTSPLWRSLSDLYDYSVHGVLPTISALGDGSLIDVETFLEGIDGLREYLREDDGDVPKLSKATIALARARQELDESDLDQQIAIGRVAMLARLPEEVVWSRLGSAPGAPIPVPRARDALTHLFGFVATGATGSPPFNYVQSVPMELPIDVVRAINERAGRAKVAPFEILRLAFAEEIGRDTNQCVLADIHSVRPVNSQ